jgi:large subunit ribosomal protein L25
MKTVSMSGSSRESVGKKDAKLQRSEGRIPCVLYGGKEQIKFVAEEKSFHQIVFTPDSFFIKLTIDGKSHDCVLKDIQYHPVSDTILHADFIEFEQDKPLTMSVPVKFTGNAPGLIKGGELVKKFRKLNVRALPADMPEAVIIDISNLDIDQKIIMSEVPQEKFKILEKPERYIIAIRPTRVTATVEPGAEGAAPAPAPAPAK